MDTSAWVQYDRASGSRVDVRLTDLIGTDGPIAITEPIRMEVLAGARDDERQADLRRLLERFALLPFESTTDFEGAVSVYRRCRAQGITPRGLIDCMIAAVAIRTGASLLAHDRDLASIASVMELRLDEAALRP